MGSPNAARPGFLPRLITPPRSVMGQQGITNRGMGGVSGVAGLPGGVAGIAGLPQGPQPGGMLGSFDTPAGPLGAMQDLFAPQQQQQRQFSIQDLGQNMAPAGQQWQMAGPNSPFIAARQAVNPMAAPAQQGPLRRRVARY
jgi:hypothetical protein